MEELKLLTVRVVMIFYVYSLRSGIGSGASRGLVEGVAKESGGSFEMIDDSDVRAGKVSEKVMRLLDRITRPALVETSLHWDPRAATTSALPTQVGYAPVMYTQLAYLHEVMNVTKWAIVRHYSHIYYIYIHTGGVHCSTDTARGSGHPAEYSTERVRRSQRTDRNLCEPRTDHSFPKRASGKCGEPILVKARPSTCI
jgi:hypothetical protein